MAVAARQARNRPEAGRHEGRPVLHQHEIRAFAADPAPDPHQFSGFTVWTHRVDVQIGRSGRRHRLALPREEQRRVLQREGPDLNLRTPALERPRQDLQNRRQSAPIRVGGPHNGDFHSLIQVIAPKSAPAHLPAFGPTRLVLPGPFGLPGPGGKDPAVIPGRICSGPVLLPLHAGPDRHRAVGRNLEQRQAFPQLATHRQRLPETALLQESGCPDASATRTSASRQEACRTSSQYSASY